MCLLGDDDNYKWFVCQPGCWHGRSRDWKSLRVGPPLPFQTFQVQVQNLKADLQQTSQQLHEIRCGIMIEDWFSSRSFMDIADPSKPKFACVLNKYVVVALKITKGASSEFILRSWTHVFLNRFALKSFDEEDELQRLAAIVVNEELLGKWLVGVGSAFAGEGWCASLTHGKPRDCCWRTKEFCTGSPKDNWLESQSIVSKHSDCTSKPLPKNIKFYSHALCQIPF